MSTTATSGWMRVDQRQQLVAVAGQPHDLEPGLLEQPGEALAQDHGIVGERYSHGTSARSEVPRPGGLDTVIVPPSASIRSASPRSPEPPVGLAPPIPSSATSTTSRPTGAGSGHLDLAGVRVLGGVGQGLAREEVGGGLELLGQA